MSYKSPLQDTVVVIYMGTFAPQFAESFYQSLAQVFRLRGYPVIIKSIPGLGLGHLADSSAELAESVFEDDKRYILVGHSQGALHAFNHAKQYGDQIAAVFAFGAPFHGTRLANLGHWLSAIPAIRNMASHSRYLRELRSDQTYTSENVYSMFSVLDELVVPFFASSVKGANNVVLAPEFIHKPLIKLGFRRSRGVELVNGWAEHLGVIWHPALHNYVDDVLDQLEAGG
jgi:pimeloyl-ACP methyl ester carboxylesterase